jgi:hypothetical protein
MSRSNGNNGHGGPTLPPIQGQPARQPVPQWRHPADPDPHAQAPQAPYGQQPGYPAQQHPQQNWQPPGYPQAQPPQAGQQGNPQAYYFPPQPVHPQAYPEQTQAQHDPNQQAYPPQQGYQPPFEPYPTAPAAPGLSSYAPPAPHAQDYRQDPRTQDPRTQDPRNYDFGNYAVARAPAAGFPQQVPGQPQHGYGLDPNFGADPYAQQGQHPGYAPDPHQGQRYPVQQQDPSLEIGAYGRDGVHQAYAAQQHGYANPNDPNFQQDQAELDDEGYDGEYEEEAPRGKRTLLVVAALIGAIGIGGGLAYGYKTFGGGGKAQIAKIDQTKQQKPIVASGGREFTNTNSKIPERLPEPINQAASSNGDTADTGGPRKVQTIAIGPVPTPSAPPGQPPQGRVASSVPGVTLDNLPMPGRPSPPAIPMPAAVPVQQVQAPVQQPSPKAVQPRIANAAPAVEVPAPVAKAPQLPRVKSADAYSPKAPAGQSGGVQTAAVATAAPTSSGGGNGYVAVLSSQGSRMDALKVYADLQQKYGDVLANKPAEVQEAVVNGKTYYRAVVGPPGSRNAANEICTQIKAAGHKDCFPSAY